MIIGTCHKRKVERIRQLEQFGVSLEAHRQPLRCAVVQFERVGVRERILPGTGEARQIEWNRLDDHRFATVRQPEVARQMIAAVNIDRLGCGHRQHVHMLATAAQLEAGEQYDTIAGARRIAGCTVDRAAEAFVIRYIRHVKTARRVPAAHLGLRPVRTRIV